MTRQRIVNAALATMEELRNTLVPNPETRGITSTGNMAWNALNYEITGDVLSIYIDPKIAPYVYYTNEPWKGKSNPNEGWWDVFANEFIRRFNEKLGGTIER